MPELVNALAEIWNVLLLRRDIDAVVNELFGKYTFSTSFPAPGDCAGDLLFDIVCWFRTIFDLQRTHLQSWTPYDGTLNIAATRGLRLYLISYGLVLQMVTFLLHGLSNELSTPFRGLLIQAILSGVRVLCLHPDSVPFPQGLMDLFERSIAREGFSQRDKATLERCYKSLRDLPAKDQYLRLSHIETKLYPLDKQYLVKTAEVRIKDYKIDPLRRYWALYDISWSIVSAVINCRADKAKEAEKKAYEVALEISRLLGVSEKDCPSDSVSVSSTELFWPLGPLLDQTNIQYLQSSAGSGGTDLELDSLKRFIGVLTGRHQAIRDSDPELRQVLSEVSELCFNQEAGSRDHHTSSQLGEYVVNCPLAHIITEENVQSLLNNESVAQEPKTHEVAQLRDGQQCPTCRDPRPITLIREIKQLRLIRRTATSRLEGLDKLRKFREEQQGSGAHSVSREVDDPCQPHSAATDGSKMPGSSGGITVGGTKNAVPSNADAPGLSVPISSVSKSLTRLRSVLHRFGKKLNPFIQSRVRGDLNEKYGH